MANRDVTVTATTKDNVTTLTLSGDVVELPATDTSAARYAIVALKGDTITITPSGTTLPTDGTAVVFKHLDTVTTKSINETNVAVITHNASGEVHFTLTTQAGTVDPSILNDNP